MMTPSHIAILRRGVRNARDYERLLRTLMWDTSNRLVTAEQATRVMELAMPAGMRKALAEFLATEKGRAAMAELKSLRAELTQPKAEAE